MFRWSSGRSGFGVHEQLAYSCVLSATFFVGMSTRGTPTAWSLYYLWDNEANG